MKRILVLILALVCSSAFAVDLGSDFPAKGFARGDALNAKFDALNDGKIDATGTANITGSLTVTGKATVGTLESGAATFTAAIRFTPGGLGSFGIMPVNNGDYGIYTPYTHRLGANSYYNGSAFVKYRVGSPSAMLVMSCDDKNAYLYTSDSGNADPTQNGPYLMWHGGLSAYKSAGSLVLSPTSTDGADSYYAGLDSTGAGAVTRGGAVYAYGNEHATNAGMVLVQCGDVASGSFVVYVNNGIKIFEVKNNGGVFLPYFAGGGATTATLDNDGQLIRTPPSDSRYKTDVQPLVGALDKVRAIRGVSFNWIDKAKYGPQREVGCIAQEVEAVLPEIVSTPTDPNQPKWLDYPKLTALLIEAMKQQQAQIESLESRINALEGK